MSLSFHMSVVVVVGCVLATVAAVGPYSDEKDSAWGQISVSESLAASKIEYLTTTISFGNESLSRFASECSELLQGFEKSRDYGVSPQHWLVFCGRDHVYLVSRQIFDAQYVQQISCSRDVCLSHLPSDLVTLGEEDASQIIIDPVIQEGVSQVDHFGFRGVLVLSKAGWKTDAVDLRFLICKGEFAHWSETSFTPKN